MFDTELLESLQRGDRRMEFIWDSITELRAALRRLSGKLVVRHGQVQAVYTNHDYEPDAVERDLAVERALVHHGPALRTFKDQAVFARSTRR